MPDLFPKAPQWPCAVGNNLAETTVVEESWSEVVGFRGQP